MKKSQKSKIVLCSILGLAAISIGSVGFATWLVGVNKTTEELHVEALVDNSVNDSQYIEISVANNTFHVAETTAIERDNTHIVGASEHTEGSSGLGVQTDALQFTINDFTVLIGKGVTEDMIRTQIDSGVKQVDETLFIDKFETAYNEQNRAMAVKFTARNNEGLTVTGEKSYE